MKENLLFLIPLLPLAGAAVNMVLGTRLPRRLAVAISVSSVAAATLLTMLLWPLCGGEGTRATLYAWLESGSFRAPVEILFDPLSAPMALMVTSVSTLIHIYASGYMKEERDYARFFALLNLFVFAMLVIVLADSLLLLFLGWEGVGFCSYALIGFWYREEKNADAGRKAFLVTRVGDVFLGIAVLWSFALLGTVSISALNAGAADLPCATVTLLSLLLLGGACGKSAQLPLMTWLPDAMAGPTPVSALIHAATMVTAGVYLLCRLFPLVSLSPGAMATIATVGALTALYAATCALAQREIKRVLAYSTMSQVGYMFLAVGAGTVSGAMFHLFTHAFFKALLFMAAGCVIHLAGGENDIYRMGGMRRKSPLLFWSFLAGGLCLAGFPLTGGFFSKDGILLATLTAAPPLYRGLWAVGALTALLTAFYTFRLLYLVFAGEPRQRHHGHYLPPVMGITLLPLAALGLGGGLLNLPALYGGNEALTRLLGPLAGRPVHASHELEWTLAGLAAAILVAGWAIAHWRYARFRGDREAAPNRFLRQGWGADWLVEKTVLVPFRALATFSWKGADQTVIDGLLESAAAGCQGAGERLRRLTTGRLSVYLQSLAWGLVAVLGWMLIALVK
ncbi:NADH-quinone oxidoreductase subunit L [uncultured Desulfuromonas sp.]|uniref:NADH-quinone oxidoreductase subunit L n=1 Tax=uncultured Desulfuromonas sp. TaxID=181013 RepID=UPI00261EAB6D|nr:NADH-quinone oxidoreductase subunit L [uncultured Desulfuromonas sp.]